MCCEDHLHCCPHNTVCNVQAGTCDSVSDAGAHLTIPWVSKTPAVALVPENQQCDETSVCPTGTTCCKQESGTWACCLLPQVYTHTHTIYCIQVCMISHTYTSVSSQAVCCEDHEHCCPQGYKCDVAHESCEHPTLPSMPWVRKQPALSVMRSTLTDPSSNVVSDSQHEHKCDARTSCPRGNTCCFMTKLSQWGCCPLPQVTHTHAYNYYILYILPLFLIFFPLRYPL